MENIDIMNSVSTEDLQLLDTYLDDNTMLVPEANYEPENLGFDISELTLDESDFGQLPSLPPEWVHEDDTESDFEIQWNQHWKKNGEYILMREWYRKHHANFDPMLVTPKYMRLDDSKTDCVKQEGDFLVIKEVEVETTNESSEKTSDDKDSEQNNSNEQKLINTENINSLHSYAKCDGHSTTTNTSSNNSFIHSNEKTVADGSIPKVIKDEVLKNSKEPQRESENTSESVSGQKTKEDILEEKRQERLQILWHEHYMEIYWHEFGLYCNKHNVDDEGIVGKQEKLEITEVDDDGNEISEISKHEDEGISETANQEDEVPENALVIDWQDLVSGKVIFDDLLQTRHDFKHAAGATGDDDESSESEIDSPEKEEENPNYENNESEQNVKTQLIDEEKTERNKETSIEKGN